MKDKKDQIYNILKKEIDAGFAIELDKCPDNCTMNPITIDEPYMKVEVNYLKNYLQQHGVKFLSREDYEARMKAYFHVDPANGSRMLYSDCEEAKGLDDLVPVHDIQRLVTGIYISDEGLVTYVYRLPYLINYQTRYPELYKMEQHLSPEVYDEQHNAIGLKEFWYEEYKDIYGYRNGRNINQVIRSNLETVLRLNKYLLDGDQTQFEWLFNNTSILQDLMPVYGYEGDKNLIENLLKKKHIKDLLWYKGCKQRVDLGEDYKYDGKLEIHTKTFKIIAEKLKDRKFKTPQANIYLDALCEAIGDIKNSRKLDKKEQDELTDYILDFMGRYVEDKNALTACTEN